MPNTSATAASSGTDLNGMAASERRETIKRPPRSRLPPHHYNASREHRLPAGRVRFGGEEMAFADLVEEAYLGARLAVLNRLLRTPEISWDRDTATGHPFFYFAYGAACREVAIDTLTGEIQVDARRYPSRCRRARSIPRSTSGQIEGGFIQGMGWLTTEELVFDAGRRLRTARALDLQDPDGGRCPADFRIALFDECQPRDDDRPFEGGRRAAADAGDFRIQRHRGRLAQPGSRSGGGARCAGDAGRDFEGGEAVASTSLVTGGAEMSLYGKLETMIERDGRAVLVSVADVKGSAPREVGAAMAVAADGSFSGSIGGGALEWQALAEAQSFASSSAPATLKTISRSLGPDLGQCCGGRVMLTLERLGRDDLPWLRELLADTRQPTVGSPTTSGHFTRRLASAAEAAQLPPTALRQMTSDGRLLERANPPSRLMLFGAGHVGRAIVLAFAALPFRLTWIDPRKDAFPQYVPQNVEPLISSDPAGCLATEPGGSLILIMTHSHALDLEIAMAALSMRRFPLVGVIGSATKHQRFITQMRQAGLADEDIRHLVCPIGLAGIAGKEPATIAASVAAQCLMLRNSIGCERR